VFQVDLVMSPCGGNHHVGPPGSAATVSYNFTCLDLTTPVRPDDPTTNFGFIRTLKINSTIKLYQLLNV